jgi:hypothetical protein
VKHNAITTHRVKKNLIYFVRGRTNAGCDRTLLPCSPPHVEKFETPTMRRHGRSQMFSPQLRRMSIVRRGRSNRLREDIRSEPNSSVVL